MIERHDRAARVPEEEVNAFFEQGAAEDLGTGQSFCHQEQSRVKGLGST
jgi:hypothetical protein